MGHVDMDGFPRQSTPVPAIPAAVRCSSRHGQPTGERSRNPTLGGGATGSGDSFDASLGNVDRDGRLHPSKRAPAALTVGCGRSPSVQLTGARSESPQRPMVPRKRVPRPDEVFGTPDLAAPSPKDAKGSPPDVGATSNGLGTTVHAQDSTMDSAVPATKQDDAGADVPAWQPGMTAVLFDDRDHDRSLCRPIVVVDPESAK